jgi:hypothetical protein
MHQSEMHCEWLDKTLHRVQKHGWVKYDVDGCGTSTGWVLHNGNHASNKKKHHWKACACVGKWDPEITKAEGRVQKHEQHQPM